MCQCQSADNFNEVTDITVTVWLIVIIIIIIITTFIIIIYIIIIIIHNNNKKYLKVTINVEK